MSVGITYWQISSCSVVVITNKKREAIPNSAIQCMLSHCVHVCIFCCIKAGNGKTNESVCKDCFSGCVSNNYIQFLMLSDNGSGNSYKNDYITIEIAYSASDYNNVMFCIHRPFKSVGLRDGAKKSKKCNLF